MNIAFGSEVDEDGELSADCESGYIQRSEEGTNKLLDLVTKWGAIDEEDAEY